MRAWSISGKMLVIGMPMRKRGVACCGSAEIVVKLLCRADSVAKDRNPRYLVRLLLAKETHVLSESCKRDL